MISIAIDDEPLALDIIEAFCEKIPHLELARTFTKTSDAERYLAQFPVDLVFIDIQMPNLNGIDFYKRLKIKPLVIFTTAFTEYAVEGFNVNAVDYLLKPFTFQRFEKAIEKAKEYYQITLQTNSKVSNYLLVRSEYSLVKIEFESILYIETMDDYLKVYLTNKKSVLTLMTMKEILTKLPQDKFIRVHRSYIVQLDKIHSVRGKNILCQAVEIPIGTSYLESFQEIYKGG
jgi:DNA-binding LytR/AlgR family response regulator